MTDSKTRGDLYHSFDMNNHSSVSDLAESINKNKSCISEYIIYGHGKEGFISIGGGTQLRSDTSINDGARHIEAHQRTKDEGTLFNAIRVKSCGTNSVIYFMACKAGNQKDGNDLLQRVANETGITVCAPTINISVKATVADVKSTNDFNCKSPNTLNNIPANNFQFNNSSLKK